MRGGSRRRLATARLRRSVCSAVRDATHAIPNLLDELAPRASRRHRQKLIAPGTGVEPCDDDISMIDRDGVGRLARRQYLIHRAPNVGTAGTRQGNMLSDLPVLNSRDLRVARLPGGIHDNHALTPKSAGERQTLNARPPQPLHDHLTLIVRGVGAGDDGDCRLAAMCEIGHSRGTPPGLDTGHAPSRHVQQAARGLRSQPRITRRAVGPHIVARIAAHGCRSVHDRRLGRADVHEQP